MGDFLDQANHPTTIYIVNTLNKIRERRMDTNWTTLTAGVDCGMVVREALRQFQSFAGLSPSGNYDFTTEQTLLKYSQDITYGMDPVEEYFIYNYERIYPVANMLSSIVGTLASYGDDLTVEMINKHQADLNELQLEMKKIMEDIEKLQSKSIDSPGRIDDSPIWNQVDTAKGQARRRSLPPPEQREQLINNAGKTVVKRQGKAGNTFKSAVRAGTPVLNRTASLRPDERTMQVRPHRCRARTAGRLPGRFLQRTGRRRCHGGRGRCCRWYSRRRHRCRGGGVRFRLGGYNGQINRQLYV